MYNTQKLIAWKIVW